MDRYSLAGLGRYFHFFPRCFVLLQRTSGFVSLFRYLILLSCFPSSRSVLFCGFCALCPVQVSRSLSKISFYTQTPTKLALTSFSVMPVHYHYSPLGSPLGWLAFSGPGQNPPIPDFCLASTHCFPPGACPGTLHLLQQARWWRQTRMSPYLCN